MNSKLNTLYFSALALLLLNLGFPNIARAVFEQQGKASYYSDAFHGRKTASGEKYDKHDFTAAHRELAFNTLVKVTNLANGRSVVVRINDRGPFSGGRVIDMSKAAAKHLDMMLTGTAVVKIVVVGDPPGPEAVPNPVLAQGPPELAAPKNPKPDPKPTPEPTAPIGTQTAAVLPGLRKQYTQRGIYDIDGKPYKGLRWTVQLGLFKNLDNANALIQQAAAAGFYQQYLEVIGQAPNFQYRVVYGNFSTQDQANAAALKLKAQQIEGYVVNLEPPIEVPAGKPGNTLVFAETGAYYADGTRAFPAQVGEFGIQIGSYMMLENAISKCQEAQEMGYSRVYITVQVKKGKVDGAYRVLMGAYPSEDVARTNLETIRQQGLDGFVSKHL
jgi:rare lipoprotein A